MAKLHPVGRAGLLCVALGTAFWAGRTTHSPEAGGSTDGRTTKSAQRSQASSTARPDGTAVSASQLKDILHPYSRDYVRGAIAADKALSGMSSSQLASLVAELAESEKNLPHPYPQPEMQAAFSRWAEVDPESAWNYALTAKPASFRSLAVSSVIPMMAKNDPQLTLSKLAEIKDSDIRSTARNAVLFELSNSQPDAWVDLVKTDPVAAKSWGITNIVSRWAMDDPAAAAKRWERLPDSIQRGGSPVIASLWAAKDPAAATAWVDSLPDSTEKTKAKAAIIAAVANTDPDAALASLSSMPGAGRMAGIGAVFQSLGNQDFKAAVERASGLKDEKDQRAAFEALLGRDPWSGSSTNRSLEQMQALMEKLPRGALRTQALDIYASKLSIATKEEADRLLQAAPDEERGKMQQKLLQYLSYSDPARALTFYDSLPATQTDGSSLNSIIGSLAEQDPAAALKVANERSSSGDRIKALEAVFSKIGRSDPETAKRELASITDGPGRTTALSSLMTGWAAVDPEEALKWTQSLEGPEQSKALLAAIPYVSERNPALAASTLTPLLGIKDSEGKLSSAASGIASSWTRQDPSAAANWASSLPEGSTRDNAISNVSSNWSRQDPDGAGKWIDSMPDGKTRDRAVSGMVNTISDRDPALAMKWANSVEGEHERGYMVENIVNRWSKSDPTAARAAAEKADIPDAQRQMILKRLDAKAASATQ